jgi:ribosomal protein L11 methyltransferase
MAQKSKKKSKATESALPPWRRCTVDVLAGLADTLSGMFLDQGALGLETEDDETRAVPGRAMMPTGRSTIIATFPRADGLEARIADRVAHLVRFIPKAQDVELSWSDLYLEDWDAIFKAHWKPFRLGARIWICPSWERANFHAERVFEGPPPLVLHLDPGMAFGTGTHETTQLCVEAMEAAAATGSMKRLLDVGTGTGILCLVALRLDPKLHAKGTDIDPVAVKAALDNARDNGVGERFTSNDDMPDREGPVFDHVIANILAGTLIDMVESLVGSVARGGTLWLSGILTEQEPAVRECYVRAGLVHLQTVTKGGWVRIDLKKP